MVIWIEISPWGEDTVWLTVLADLESFASFDLVLDIWRQARFQNAVFQMEPSHLGVDLFPRGDQLCSTRAGCSYQHVCHVRLISKLELYLIESIKLINLCGNDLALVQWPDRMWPTFRLWHSRHNHVRLRQLRLGAMRENSGSEGW